MSRGAGEEQDFQGLNPPLICGLSGRI